MKRNENETKDPAMRQNRYDYLHQKFTELGCYIDEKEFNIAIENDILSVFVKKEKYKYITTFFQKTPKLEFARCEKGKI